MKEIVNTKDLPPIEVNTQRQKSIVSLKVTNSNLKITKAWFLKMLKILFRKTKYYLR